MPHHVHVEVISASEMRAAVRQFYVDRTPGDDRESTVLESVDRMSPINLLAAYRWIRTAQDAEAVHERAKAHLRWVDLSLGLYLAAAGVYGLRAAALRPDGPGVLDGVLGLVMLAVLTAAVISSAIALRKRSRR